MAKLKSARHHWWPQGVSEYWKNAEGGVHWLLPNGEVRTSVPRNFGMIGNGHLIKMGSDPEVETIWDDCFEVEFQRADDNFPSIIDQLKILPRKVKTNMVMKERFLGVEVPNDFFEQLIECLVSLAVRSPMNREASVALAEALRGPLPERERNRLLGANLRFTQRNAMRCIGGRGKVAIIYSPDREFIFGDGFFHNILSPADNINNPVILAPLTPRISALFVVPMRYSLVPRLSTVVLSNEETIALNDTVQIYARQAIFYRSERPKIIADYAVKKHLVYAEKNNPIQSIIQNMPGITPTDRSLDWLFGLDFHNGTLDK